MKTNISRMIKDAILSQHNHSLWKKILSVMMAVVVFCTTYALILPALTLSGDLICGFEEHTHTSSCYTTNVVNVKTLVCEQSDDGELIVHTHNEYCYDDTGKLICELTECAEHSHTSDCYDDSGTLTCNKEEIVLHTHSDDCYSDGTLTCDLPVVVEHQHTSECVEISDETVEETVLNCGLEEHTHTASCYSVSETETSIDTTSDSDLDEEVENENNEYLLTSKPTYSPYATVSDAQSDEINLGDDLDFLSSGGALTYSSDASTSNIEKILGGVGSELSDDELYSQQVSNDGRIITDKSVVYGNDDYGAIDSSEYSTGDFSVTLSALGQNYTLREAKEAEQPLDVVFVFDVSGSMTNKSLSEDSDSNQRWEDGISAINYAMEEVLNNSVHNRVGLVAFSNAASTVLELDRYTADDNKYLTFDDSASSPYLTIQTADSIASESGITVGKFTFLNSKGFWGGTYTQRGIQEAYKVLTEYNDSYTEMMDYDMEVGRQPVIILISDGDPTLSTYTYTDPLNGSTYGKTQPYAAHAYYTILSANYFKNMTSYAYGTPAYFYTIGMGIMSENHGNYSFSTGCTSSSFSSSTCLDSAYVRAVLDPSTANIDSLIDILPDSLPESQYSLYNNATLARRNSIDKLWARTNTFLYNLLMQDFVSTGTSQTVGSGSYTGVGTTSSTIPLLYNNYYDSTAEGYGYNYCDGAFFGQLNEEDLEGIFDDIIENFVEVNRCDYLLKKGTNLTFTDVIGDDMEVKTQPVLQYGGTNYSATDISSYSDDSCEYTVYNWNFTVDRENYCIETISEEVDLSGVTATVIYNKLTGSQKIVFEVPYDVVPSLFVNSFYDYYFEELPIRLIYKVGLTDAEKNKLDAKISINNATYYTNKLGETTVEFTAYNDNPYYSNEKTITKEKLDNTTETLENYFEEKVAKNREYYKVTQTLGNNGKIIISRGAFTQIDITKEWKSKHNDLNSVNVEVYGVGYVLYNDYDDTGYFDENGTHHLWSEDTYFDDDCYDSTGSADVSEGKRPFTALVKKLKINYKKDWKSNTGKIIVEDYTDYSKIVYTNYYVREVATDGYAIAYADSDGNTITKQKLNLIKNGETKTINVAQVPVADADGNHSITIINSKHYSLPGTGGIGTQWFAVIGILIMFGSFVGFMAYKRKQRANN